jgi:translation elongation factor P/translation initiation factor 5A
MVDGKPYVVVDFQFVKPGKGQAFTRVQDAQEPDRRLGPRAHL